MQPFSFFFLVIRCGGGGISGRVRALNLTVPLGSGRVGSDDLGYGPGSCFSFEPVQTSSADPVVVLYASISVLNWMRAATGSQCKETKRSVTCSFGLIEDQSCHCILNHL